MNTHHEPLKFQTLTQTTRGKVSIAHSHQKTCVCIQIQFDHLLWQFPRTNLENLYRYISYLNSPEGFAQNAYNQYQTVVAMSGHKMMALMTREALEKLQELLQMARVSLLNNDLKAELLSNHPLE